MPQERVDFRLLFVFARMDDTMIEVCFALSRRNHYAPIKFLFIHKVTFDCIK